MKKIILFTLVIAFFTPAWADITPKPEIQFSFIYNTANKPLVDPVHSEQIQCKDSLCMQSEPLGSYGKQRLYCSAGDCYAIAYKFTPYQQLSVTFTDGSVRESNIFPVGKDLLNRYNVYVEEDHLFVEPSGYEPGIFEHGHGNMWLALLLILVLELVAALAYLIYTQKSFMVLYSVAIVNLITTLLVWTILPHFVSSVFVLWFLCTVLESLGIWAINRKHLTLVDATKLSVIMNVTSYSLGMIIAFMLA